MFCIKLGFLTEFVTLSTSFTNRTVVMSILGVHYKEKKRGIPSVNK